MGFMEVNLGKAVGLESSQFESLLAVSMSSLDLFAVLSSTLLALLEFLLSIYPHHAVGIPGLCSYWFLSTYLFRGGEGLIYEKKKKL